MSTDNKNSSPFVIGATVVIGIVVVGFFFTRNKKETVQPLVVETAPVTVQSSPAAPDSPATTDTSTFVAKSDFTTNSMATPEDTMQGYFATAGKMSFDEMALWMTPETSNAHMLYLNMPNQRLKLETTYPNSAMVAIDGFSIEEKKVISKNEAHLSIRVKANKEGVPEKLVHYKLLKIDDVWRYDSIIGAE